MAVTGKADRAAGSIGDHVEELAVGDDQKPLESLNFIHVWKLERLSSRPAAPMPAKAAAAGTTLHLSTPEATAVKVHFSSKSPSWGYPMFLSLGDLHDPSKGFLVNDTCQVKVLFY